jgi:hypothetical protein
MLGHLLVPLKKFAKIVRAVDELGAPRRSVFAGCGLTLVESAAGSDAV